MEKFNKHLFGRSDIDQKNYYRQTTESEEVVLALLKGSPEVDISDIKVFVHNHEIHLEGYVENNREKRMVESLVTNYFDNKIVNDLQIKSDEDQLDYLY